MKQQIQVKGKPATARRHIIERGIVGSSYRCYSKDYNYSSFIVESDPLTLNEWFCEPNNGAPFDAGTLLFWTPLTD